MRSLLTRMLCTSLILLGVLIGISALSGEAQAFPEFEKAIEETSGRLINCAYCHEHPDGPDGMNPGQIDSLSPLQFKELNRARTSFDPGGNINSPILNDFGDHIINVIGKKKVVALKNSPLEIAALLGDGDLDHDGIPDGEEFLDGTHPLIHHHGAPSKLFVSNFLAFWPHLLMLFLATILGIYGIENLLNWFSLEARKLFDTEEDET